MPDDGDAHGVGFNLARPVNEISRLFGVIASLIPIKLRLAIAGAPRRVRRLHSVFCTLFFPRRYRRRTRRVHVRESEIRPIDPSDPRAR